MEPNELDVPKSIFPAYSGYTIPSTKASLSGCDHMGWLQNDSFVAKHAEELHNKEDEELYLGQNVCSEAKQSRPEKKLEKVTTEQKYSESNCISSKSIFIKGTNTPLQGSHYIDTRSDHDNLAFRFMYPEHVAFYNQHKKFPLGLNKKHLKHWLIGNKEVKCKKVKSTNRYHTKTLPKTCELELSKSNLANVLHRLQDYIPLEISTLNLDDSKEPKISSSCKTTGIHTEGHELYHINSEGNITLSESSHKPPPEQYMYKKTLYFNKLLQANPKNENLWLQFLEFQDEILTEEQKHRKSNVAKSHNKATVEKKLAIIDKAITANPNSVVLAVARLELCQDIWEVDYLLQQWENLINCHSHDALLWKKYIFFVQSHLTHFSASHTIELYIKSLQALTKDLKDSSSCSISYCEEEAIIDIFAQMCIFLYQCGYRERAVATYQALIEFNLCHPASFDSSEYSSLIAFFEPFWDSGMPRFGEENSKGWGKVMEEKNLTIAKSFCDKENELNTKENEILKENMEESVAWIRLEALREEYFWLPWRPNPDNDETEDSCEDPERMVLIDDVSSAMFLLTSVKAKFHLILQFLQFLGVNTHEIPCPSVNYECAIRTAKDVIEMLFTKSFSPTNNSQTAGFISVHSILPSSKERISFINRVFKQVTKLFPLHFRKYLELIWLKFTIENLKNENNSLSKEGHKVAKKLAKTLLKEEHNRNDLAMWKEYGLLEWVAGNTNDARNTFETILSSYNIEELSGAQVKHNLWQLIRTFVEVESGMYFSYFNYDLNIQSKTDVTSRVIWILTHIGREGKYVPYVSQSNNFSTILLRARNNHWKILMKELCHLSDNGDAECICFDSDIHLLTDCASCYLYLQYFSQGMQTAKLSFETILEKVKMEHLELPHLSRIFQKVEEMISMTYIQLLNFHTWKNHTSLAPLRSGLQTALEKYPANPIFLQCFYALETGSLITGYFHRFYAKLLQQSSSASPILWLFAIFTELKRYSYICSISEQVLQANPLSDYATIPGSTAIWKIRSLFERALKSLSGEECIVLWRLYIKFEMFLNEKSRGKQLFYQALQKCPWLKILYIDGVQHFPEDLQQIFDLMTEKEIRVNAPIEEVTMLLKHISEENMQ